MTPQSGTIRVFKISRPNMGWYLEKDIKVAMEELSLQYTESAPGDSVTFTVVEMSREEYEALPEFTGW